MIDLHVHTWRCRHATGTADEYVQAASARGVRTLAFTEHLPLAPAIAARIPGAAGYAMPEEEWDAYLAEVAQAAVLGAELGVEVLCGVEVDAVPSGYAHAREMLSRHSLDLVLGSVHFVDDWAFDDPAHMARYEEWRTEDLWERYFADLTLAAREGIADVMAHADLVKKFAVRPDGPVDHLYERTASALREAGVAVEVNAAGLRKPCAELYPAPAFLRVLRRAGVPVTMGSDAHAPEEVGMGLDEAAEALRDAGYRSVLVYRRRQAEEVGLDEL